MVTTDPHAIETREALRINGRAELSADPELLERLAARGRPAVLAIRVRVEECFFHCGKAFLRAKTWQPESWPERKKVSFGKMFAKRTGSWCSRTRSRGLRANINRRTKSRPRCTARDSSSTRAERRSRSVWFR